MDNEVEIRPNMLGSASVDKPPIPL